jgi:hypothetical protein
MESPVDDAALMPDYRDGDPEAFATHYRRDAGYIESDPREPSEAPGEEQ